MAEFTRQDFNQAAGQAGQTGFKWAVRGIFYGFVAAVRFIADLFKQFLGK